jgi:dTDP-4-dehydrorhamnose reductase
MTELQLWGGHECTVNRVGDAFHDQTLRSGHHQRLDDLDLFADLGLRTLRYPVLWERVAPDRPDQMDWSWSDARMSRMGRLGISPIVGLVHHGSGPRYTDLLDPGFAPGLARFARAVAERYPHVEDWTPVNEPLTTARFSALYGLWRPHVTDERAFWTALLNQVEAVAAAMAEIRAVNPRARLIQTEDLGHSYSTAPVAEQAAFDNERRWMTWDLLTGRVTRDHPLWDRLAARGFADRLKRIADQPCPPDVIGVNHYVTSDRFLDHNLDRYPVHTHGGNVMQRFADVEAIRVMNPAPAGLQGALEEAWARYGATLAVTECHLGCTREEQARWLLEGWDTALRLRAEGVDIRAVTAWSLLGAHDWNSLLTLTAGSYEVGAFDISSGAPRPTALASTIRALCAGGQGDLPPASQGPGWWRRDIRLAYAPVLQRAQDAPPARSWRPPPQASRPILIAGASGTLGQALARACEWRGLAYVLTDRRALDLSDPQRIAESLDRHQPWAVINAAGWVRVDDAEREPDACLRANRDGALSLAQACHQRDLRFVGFSSDLVFDGRAGRAYDEDDAASPLNVYGRSKADAEQLILALGGRALMVRTAAFFSPFDPHNFAAQVARDLASEDGEVVAAEDLVVSPTYVPDLVQAVLDLVVDGERGLWHLTNGEPVSWAQFARRIAAALGHDPARVRGVASQSLGWTAPRPAYAPLTSRRGAVMPSLDDAVARFAQRAEHEDVARMTAGGRALGLRRGLLVS